MIREREYSAMSGWAALFVLAGAVGLCVWRMILSFRADDPAMGVTFLFLLLLAIFLLTGLFIVNPNEGKVLQLFGRYVGTARNPGLRYANPLYAKKRISLRVRNFESATLKVNDLDGNPIRLISSGNVVAAATPELHRELIALLRLDP